MRCARCRNSLRGGPPSCPKLVFRLGKGGSCSVIGNFWHGFFRRRGMLASADACSEYTLLLSEPKSALTQTDYFGLYSPYYVEYEFCEVRSSKRLLCAASIPRQ